MLVVKKQQTVSTTKNRQFGRKGSSYFFCGVRIELFLLTFKGEIIDNCTKVRLAIVIMLSGKRLGTVEVNGASVASTTQSKKLSSLSIVYLSTIYLVT